MVMRAALGQGSTERTSFASRPIASEHSAEEMTAPERQTTNHESPTNSNE